jgi:DNA-binding transcriptional ArsR family regulator
MNAMAKERDAGRQVTITDPRALKALAHPARQRLLRLLAAGEVITATEAATLVGMSPSAVSHHLRQLEKYGLAERAEATGDGRERPWRIGADSIGLNPAPGDEVGTIATQSIVGLEITDLMERLEAHQGQPEDPWGSYIGLGRRDFWLTRAEVDVIRERLEELLADFDPTRSTRSHPDGARRHTLLVSFVPNEGGGDGQAGQAGRHVPT